MITASSLTNETYTLILDNGAAIMTARKDHPKWKEIVAAHKEQDEATIRGLLSMKAVMQTYSDGELTIDGMGILYHGRPLHGVDVDRAMAFLRGSLPYIPLANYLRRSRKNPSARSIEMLYPFLEHHNMAITPEGKIIGYKGVRSDYFSVMGNKNTVVLQGEVDSEGHIRNTIGAVIEVERSSVDDNFNMGCSFGLHAGSLAYARGWGQRVILIEFDPADAVCVPAECEYQKLRLCKYKVIGEYTGPMPDTYTEEFSKEEDVCSQCGLDIDNCICLADDVRTDPDSDEGLVLSDDEWLREHAALEDASLATSVGGLISDLEKVAQETGILPGSGNLDEEDAFEEDYLEGMKQGVKDRADGVYVKYLAGDEAGADSPQHAKFIEGYVEGYK